MASLYIHPFVDEGLGNSSYLIASTDTGLAAAIDPQRDIDRYAQVAEGLGLHLIYGLDTHLHADFVSGTRELAARLTDGFRIGVSADAHVGYEHIALREGDTLALGDVALGVVTTPGHTPEHISFTASVAGAKVPQALFSGGALIAGGAGRTDLLGPDLSESLAHQLYHTIHQKLLNLADEVQVYPTHGAGSFCSAPARADRVTTIGRERRSNRFVQVDSEDAFVRLAQSNLPSYPTYYRYLRAVNQRGPHVLGGVPVLAPLSPQRVYAQMARGAALIDLRSPREFAQGHVPNSYGIPHLVSLSTWAGWVVPFGSPILLLADDPHLRKNAVRQLIRIGYDDVRGYLDGGFAAWAAADLPTASTPTIQVTELHEWLQRADAPRVVDVRFESEWRAGHLPDAIHVEAGRVAETGPSRIPRDHAVVVHCGAANRAVIGVSLLEQRGYRNLTLLDTGFDAWRLAGYPVVAEI